MNKDRFLAELREYLSILEKQEQEDILEEYAQHIDMKIQKGLSEEEVIGDFGSVEQLAAEILEAYHVNPEFRRQGFSFKLPRMKAGASRNPVKSQVSQGVGLSQNVGGNVQAGESRRRIGGQTKALLTRAVVSMKEAFRWMSRKCRAFAGWLMKPFGGRRTEPGIEVQKSGTLAERTKEMNGLIGRFFRTIGQGIVALWRWFVELCIFCLKFMWNTAWLLFALICAGMAMITLTGVGAIPVFLVQGYPFIGFFMISLGGLLCLGALSYGAFGMLIRGEKSGGDDDSVKNGKGEAAEVYGKQGTEEHGKSRKDEMTAECGKEGTYE